MSQDREQEPPAYHELLAKLPDTMPRLHRSLSAADRNRRNNLQRFLPGILLPGLEELLTYLDNICRAFDEDERLKVIAFLPRRIVFDFEASLEAALVGSLSVVSDLMRDVMEVELLLTDFTFHESHMDEWLRSSPRKRERTFGPGKIRKRLRDIGWDRYSDSVAGVDYRAHSESLHVSPPVHPFFGKGYTPANELTQAACFWEMFEHARRILEAIEIIRDMRAGSDWGDIPHTKELEKVRDAWIRTRRLQAMYVALIQAPSALRKELGRQPTIDEVVQKVRDQFAERSDSDTDEPPQETARST
jgi:hypothetical protein